MKRTDKYYQISLRGSKEPLKGKVIRDVAYSNDTRGEQYLVITFEDNSFMGVELASDGYETTLEDFYLANPECINGGELDSYIDTKGNVVLSPWDQQLVDLGLWEVSPDDIKKMIEFHKKQEEEREYKEYLRLKEKFENGKG